MKKLRINYPWARLEKGQGFFVPCLDLEATREEGLRKALHHRLFDARAEPCVRDGFTGVWFFRIVYKTVPTTDFRTVLGDPAPRLSEP